VEEEVRESCGIFGICSKKYPEAVPHHTYNGLVSLQHRGQESAGIYTFKDGSHGELSGYKGMGLVTQVFNKTILDGLSGNASVGHVRYSTTSESNIANAQPFLLQSPSTNFALAFNGTISNFIQLRESLKTEGETFKTDTDTEVLARVIASKLKETGSYVEALKESMKILDGSYSMVLLSNKGELCAMRDPRGFKPLCLGSINQYAHVIASETPAVEAVGGKTISDVRPGEVIRVDETGFERERVTNLQRKALCMFEFVYFSRPDSIIDGKAVWEVRKRLGRFLWKLHPIKADYVIPVPDSGRAAAAGFSEESGIPLAEGLMKNRYVGRIFITPKAEDRELLVRLKLNPIRSVTAGKEIVVIDDSIVRSTTSKFIVNLLKTVGGARRVHLRISCPPIISSCYMGIDFPTRRELIASTRTVEEIRRDVGADTLGYMNIDGLVRSIGLPHNQLCMACLTGEYPLNAPPQMELLETTLGSRTQ
jgi:amidophosphoribosyltransferase